MKFIIIKDYRGFCVYVSEPGWRECEPLGIFTTRLQAEDFEEELLLKERELQSKTQK